METRNSHGLDQFCATLLEREGQAVLDLGGVNQGTVSFITENHNRLTPEDFVVEFEECFGVGEDQETNQADPERIRAFGRAVFDFPNDHFDSILLWDALEVVSPELAPLVIAELYRVIRPGGAILALFHTEEAAKRPGNYSYRIHDRKAMAMVPRKRNSPRVFYSNRHLERMFGAFQSVKFFLARDHLREILVRK